MENTADLEERIVAIMKTIYDPEIPLISMISESVERLKE
jgi:metal-sulfur cluster biosynthetic enzyme